MAKSLTSTASGMGLHISLEILNIELNFNLNPFISSQIMKRNYRRKYSLIIILIYHIITATCFD